MSEGATNSQGYEKRMRTDSQFRQRMQRHVESAVARFRPGIERSLPRNLPQWYVANYYVLKCHAKAPDWLIRANERFVAWTVVEGFPVTSRSAEDYLKAYREDQSARGRHSKPGTAALQIIDDIRTYLTYDYAEHINRQEKLKLKPKQLRLAVTERLAISEETLRDRRKRARKFFLDVPPNNSDWIIFWIDAINIERTLKRKARGI